MLISPLRRVAACWLIGLLPTYAFSLTSPAAADELVRVDQRAAEQAVSWPQWRGRSQQGVTGESGLPIQWSEESSQRVKIPGAGGSTPVIAAETAYLTSGVDGKNTLLAIDVSASSKNSPQIRWQVPLGEDSGNKHRKGSGSNPSPVTDGKHIVAYFRSGDLACVGIDGNLVWRVNLQEEFGEDTLYWDLGSSPLLLGSMVVVPVMQSGPSYLVAYDIATGEMRWKVDRMTDAPLEAAQSYSTPLAVEIDGKSAIATLGADTLTINNAADGKELARLGGFNPGGQKNFRSISSPVAHGNLVVCSYSRGNTLTAVDMEKLVAGEGRKAILWFRDDIGSDVPTPAMRDGVVYLVADGKPHKGTVFGLSSKTGETLWSVKLPRSRAGYSSSPLLAGDRLYVTAENAKTSVISPLTGSAGDEAVTPDVLTNNELADDEAYTVSSLVPMNGRLGLRTKNFFYMIGG